MKLEVNRNAEIYIMLEEYMFKFEPHEIENRWTVYKRPKDLNDFIRDRLDLIEKEKRRYEDEMLEEHSSQCYYKYVVCAHNRW